MNKSSVKVIGIKDASIKDAKSSCIKEVEGLKDIFDRDFVDWSDFDGWESISAQQWIFSKALDVYSGKKIAIKCDCCEYAGFIQSNFENIKKEKCYGIKSAFMIEKVVDEIVLAKARRDSDGTYSA